MKKWLAIFVLAAFVAGCASSHKDPDVLDPASASTSGVMDGQAESSVMQIQLDDAQSGDIRGPAQVERVIYFDFDSYTVSPEYQDVIDAHARYLRNHDGGSYVVLEGHTDQRGSREYNLALGQKRADSVQRALSLAGADGNQLEAVSFGKEKPAAMGSSESDYAQNRRVVIRYTN